MASNVGRRIARRLVRFVLACMIMFVFTVGLAVLTVIRRMRDGGGPFAWRSDARMRARNPGRRELRAVVRGLAMFAEHLADTTIRAMLAGTRR